MKIGKPADQRPIAPLENAATPAKADAARPAAAAGADPSAKVQLSEGAEALRSGGASADFDADKVAAIQQQIDSGTFKINAEVIADKLIANAQELLGRVTR